MPDGAHPPLVCDPEVILNRHRDRELLDRYYDLLMTENERVNLVSRETSRSDFERMVAESLLPLDILSSAFDGYLDIGSGGGIPGIPLLLSDSVNGAAHLIERTQKKATALRRMTEELGLNATVVSKSFEEARIERQFDLITLRYVKLRPRLWRRIFKVLSSEGKFIYYSKPDFELSGCSTKLYTFQSPQSEAAKSFTVVSKSD